MTATEALIPVRVDVLGPLRLVVDTGRADAGPVDVRGPKRRAVLALLTVAQGRTVTPSQLVDALWPGDPPASGRQAVHAHISRLRSHLGPAAERLQTRADGYALDLGPDGSDVAEARVLLGRARQVLAADPSQAYRLLRQASALWRGPVLADLSEIPPLADFIEECIHLHREVTDTLIGAAIAAGQAEEVGGVAAATLAADPLREPAALLLMRALAAAGQPHEALRIGRDYRRRLVDESGLDPSPALDTLEREIAGGSAGSGPRMESSARPTTRLVGRAEQVTILQRLLATERLVTLVGPGGVGKTRVALEIAYATDVAGVLLLAPLTDSDGIPHALASALQVNVVRGDVLAACAAVLGDRPALLLIDNCEHLLDGVRDTVTTLLSACPRLTVLATSREPLGLVAEYTSRLAPLPLPVGILGEDLSRVPSVRLFLDRARRVRPDVARTPEYLRDVADIVRRLDGIPLAIELAAGRLSTFSTSDLRDRLDRSLDLLGSGQSSPDLRHRTLRATIEWSYDLLDGDEQRMFRHLAAFADGIDLDDAERLAAALGLSCDPGTVLARLVDASMVDVTFRDGTRYRMLETIRAFGLDRLRATGEDETANQYVIRWAVALTADLAATMMTPSEPRADAALRRELVNLRAAWRLARLQQSLDAAAAIVVGLFDAVGYRDLLELRSWARDLGGDPALNGYPNASAVLGVAAEATYHAGDYPQAGALARTGLRLATDDAQSWYCLTSLSVADLARGAYTEAVEHALAAAAITGPVREGLGIAALALAYAGDLEQARTLNARQEAGALSPTMRSWAAYVSGEIEGRAGRSEVAEQHYLRAVDLARSSGATFLVGVATVGLLTVRADSGRIDEALTGYREVIDYFARTGNWTHLWVTLRNLAGLLARLGDTETAEVLFTAANQAPDAPATGADPVGGERAPSPGGAPIDRVVLLDLTRRAIERSLTTAVHQR